MTDRPISASCPFGDLTGLDRDGVAVFKGITFARAERFGEPEPVTGWDGRLDATRFRAQAPQVPGNLERLLGASRLGHDEDCLHLNVTTPGCDDRRRPVLVWIHGGAFVTGGGAMPWYDGRSLARRFDVVVVTINYRLGALGFVGDLNLGTADQLAALRWVRTAIGAFGGDPDDVTIFGESAGGASVVSLLAAPEGRELFHAVYAMSPSIPQLRDRERASTALDGLLRAASVDDLDGLRRLPLDELLAAQVEAAREPATALTAHAPTAGGTHLDDDLLDVAARDPRPLVIGTTRDEMHVFTAFDPSYTTLDEAGMHRRFTRRFGERAPDAVDAYRRHRPGSTPGQLVSAMSTDETFRVPARRLADARATHGVPTWTYWFTHATPTFGGVLGACHGMDIPFAFDNLHRPGVSAFVGDVADAATVAEEMSASVVSLTGGATPSWPQQDVVRRATKRFGAPGDVVDDPEPELRELWAQVPPA